MRSLNALFSTVAALALIGCGTSDEPAADTDVTVERGPLLYAAVTDASGQEAQMQGNGLYRFDNAPVYPVNSVGGVIDVNRNNVIDVGDMDAGTLRLQTSQGRAVTIVSSIAQSDRIRQMLQDACNLSMSEITNEVPTTNRRIAAVSDEVYKYCLENNVSDPSMLSDETVEALQTQIRERIALYLASSLSVTALEQALVQHELPVQGMTHAQAQAKQQQYGGGSGSSGGASSQAVSPLSSQAGSSRQSGASSTQQGGQGSRNDQSSVFSSSSASVNANSSCSCSASGVLNDEQNYALAYMWNEEKLAKDIYLALNEVRPHNTLYTIATRSETEHEAAVEELIATYDINITNLADYTVAYSEAELRAIGAGEFAIPKVQALYDTLYAKGVVSMQDALEVGCMVEVTDVNDLDEYIGVADDVESLVRVFTSLRSGSYNHYWAFDNALKSMGVTDGCCVLGETFCKTAEAYPSAH